MLRKLLVPALGLAILPVVAQAQQSDQDYGFNQGNWEITLGGAGQNDSHFESTVFNVQGSLGYFLTDALEVGARQSLIYNDIAHPVTWYGQTTAFADYHFDMGQLQPFVGANIAYIWGSAPNTWDAAPEGGIKYFLNHTTFVEGRIEYQFFFEPGHTAGFKDGQWLYTLALGVKF